MKALHSKDFLAGVVSVALGGAVAFTTSGYEFGSLTRMGPGFFPMSLAILLVGIGLLIMATALRHHEELPEFSLRPFVLIPLAIVAFALMLPRLGFGAAGVAAILLGGMADRHSHVMPLLLLAICLVPAVWLLFAVALGIPIDFIDWKF